MEKNQSSKSIIKRIYSHLDKKRKRDLYIVLFLSIFSSLAESISIAILIPFVSIFLNPVQFDSKKDFSKYPRNIFQDKKRIFLEKINVLYIPTIKEIFPKKKIKIIKASKISKKLCGKYRKGHFDGVVTVLKELFDQVDPNIVFFGEKDFQQVRVVQDLIKK